MKKVVIFGNSIEIGFISQECYHELSVMVGELLNEIMDALNEQVFNYNPRKSSCSRFLAQSLDSTALQKNAHLTYG